MRSGINFRQGLFKDTIYIPRELFKDTIYIPRELFKDTIYFQEVIQFYSWGVIQRHNFIPSELFNDGVYSQGVIQRYNFIPKELFRIHLFIISLPVFFIFSVYTMQVFFHRVRKKDCLLSFIVIPNPLPDTRAHISPVSRFILSYLEHWYSFECHFSSLLGNIFSRSLPQLLLFTGMVNS